MFKRFSVTDYYTGDYSRPGTVGTWLKDALMHTGIFSSVSYESTEEDSNTNRCTDKVTAICDNDSMEFKITYEYNNTYLQIYFYNIIISCNGKNYVYQTGEPDKYYMNTIIAFDGGVRLEWVYTPDRSAAGTSTNTYYYHSIVLTKIYKLINKEEQKYGDSKLALIQHSEQDTKGDGKDLSYIIQSVGKLADTDSTNYYNYFTSQMFSDTDYTTFGAILFPHGYQTKNVMWSPFTEFVDGQGMSNIHVGSITVREYMDSDIKLREYWDDINQTSVIAYRVGHLLFLDDQSSENAFY